jgi:hypothetical protein
MKNAIVYAFNVRELDIKHNQCYKQLKYSIDTARKFNKDIPIYVYVSPSTIEVSNNIFDNNTHIIKFDVEDDGGWLQEWVDLGFLEFLKHRWEKAIESIHLYGLDSVLYLDTDTVFHGDPNILFNKYNSSNYLWAKPDNSYDLMAKVQVWPGMNDGQFILSKELASKDIMTHMKSYVNHILSKNKRNLTEEEYRNLCWVSTQYAVWDYFQSKNNPVKHFDEEDVMVSTEPEFKDTSKLILHHYFSGNTIKFLPKEYS